MRRFLWIAGALIFALSLILTLFYLLVLPGSHPVNSSPLSAQGEMLERPSLVTRIHGQIKLQRLKRAVREGERKANADFTFHGRVQDQHGQVVPGCLVKYKIHKMTSFSDPPPTPTQNVTTGEDGAFTITGFGGGIEFLSLVKDGYLAAKDRGLPLSEIPATKTAPQIFEMWNRIPGPVSLLRHTLKLEFDGTTRDLFVNVVTGEVTTQDSGADIHFHCEVGAEVPGQRGFPYYLLFRAITGGINSVQDKFMLQAHGPYELGKTYNYRDNSSPSWQSGIDERMFASFRKGALNGAIVWRANFRPPFSGSTGRAWIYLEITLNPAGSPNLDSTEATWLADKNAIQLIDSATRKR